MRSGSFVGLHFIYNIYAFYMINLFLIVVGFLYNMHNKIYIPNFLMEAWEREKTLERKITYREPVGTYINGDRR